MERLTLLERAQLLHDATLRQYDEMLVRTRRRWGVASTRKTSIPSSRPI